MMHIGDPTRSAGRKSGYRGQEKPIAPKRSCARRDCRAALSVACLIEGGFAAKEQRFDAANSCRSFCLPCCSHI
jgi:hypothetical protein